MSLKKIVILDGTRSQDKHLVFLLTLLTEVLRKDYAVKEVNVLTLRDIRVNKCIGCFDCWVKTPGKCIHTADAGAGILQNVLSSDTLILFTPVVFGGHSSELKKILDRFLPIALPFFKKKYGETHHPRRYSSFPHIIGIGVQQNPDKEITKCFKILIGRNAVNAGTSYTAEVISNLASPKSLRRQFQKMFATTDDLPGVNELNALMATEILPPKISVGNRRALLIVGSPKSKRPSTSAILGGYLLDKLKRYGWETELLLLQENLLSKEGQHVLLQSFDKADTVLVAFPLYLDTLPAGMTKALEIIYSHRESTGDKKTKNFLAVVNNGLPESYQNTVALTICRHFSMKCDMTWAGGLAMAAGEQLISGQPIKGCRGFRGVKRPPLYYVARALDITASSLTNARPIPEKAVQIIAQKPVPFISFDLWRWFLMKKANSMLQKEAVKNGLDIKAMRHQPYT